MKLKLSILHFSGLGIAVAIRDTIKDWFISIKTWNAIYIIGFQKITYKDWNTNLHWFFRIIHDLFMNVYGWYINWQFTIVTAFVYINNIVPEHAWIGHFLNVSGHL